ncbi:hypothetical protein PV797_15545 [Clostridiaceae bacterium M8S5]|nr:hypothetical protein PV797_15545 [Clostridiaceae bacterium M8S5]
MKKIISLGLGVLISASILAPTNADAATNNYNSNFNRINNERSTEYNSNNKNCIDWCRNEDDIIKVLEYYTKVFNDAYKDGKLEKGKYYGNEDLLKLINE